MVAKGYFEVTDDVTDLCRANFMSSVGKRTPVAARFSTVVHPAGSPESLRDVRGFSVKFYTQEGNWDFVGNNIPVSSVPSTSMRRNYQHAAALVEDCAMSTQAVRSRLFLTHPHASCCQSCCH
jgi:catalase